ncbi:Acg family FMN-binding oxidoreductase [Streptomyces sp. BBFR102]|uniref:Acg family FMN-binding oxidoreductase n=1 Tax=Streptomyces sp. BBFR102 TaxID=3448171 RepID=UPI003F52971C
MTPSPQATEAAAAVTQERLEEMVRDACAAPSMHNAQPWAYVFHRRSGVLELLADTARTLPEEDPHRRALHLGCGAALFNLRVAAARAGLHAWVSPLPPATDGDVLAAVRLRAGEVEREAATLHEAVAERHTNRQPYAQTRIPEVVREQLERAATTERARLVFPEGWHYRMVLDVLADAEAGKTPGHRAEEEAWLRADDQAPDGIPRTATGPRMREGEASVREFGEHPDGPWADFEREPQLALLLTQRDEPADWLAAGQALQRVLLTATRAGLSAAPVTRALEQPSLRWLLRDPAEGPGHVQMVLRMGYGPAVPVRTGRRALDEVLTVRD